MEYASLCWIGASPTTLSLLDNIQKKAVKIIGVDEEYAHSKLNIASLHHRRQVAAVTTLYKMQTSSCPLDLRTMLPPPFVRRCATRSSMSMPDNALAVPYHTQEFEQVTEPSSKELLWCGIVFLTALLDRSATKEFTHSNVG